MNNYFLTLVTRIPVITTLCRAALEEIFGDADEERIFVEKPLASIYQN